MWKAIRIVVLLVLLAKAIQTTLLEEAGLNWKRSLYVAIYPINASGNKEVSVYINQLTLQDYETISDYIATQSTQYHLPVRRPVKLILGQEMKAIPPAPPSHGHFLEIIYWSLKFRFFAWFHQPSHKIKADIQLYLLYYNPNMQPILSHSTALYKGRIGRVNLFGEKSYHQQNLVILAHELLHTIKATDKYHLKNNLPIYPDGYAEPDKQPLHPQQLAELMGGRIPMSENFAIIPYSLNETKISEKTAREIGWLK